MQESQVVFGGFADRGFELRVVTLRVSEPELLRRITDRTLIHDDVAADERARRWCLDQVERCLDALDDEAFGRHVSNEGRTVAATVDEIEQILSV